MASWGKQDGNFEKEEKEVERKGLHLLLTANKSLAFPMKIYPDFTITYF